MTHMTVTPAYGRDYKTKGEVLKAWSDGKDFIIQGPPGYRWAGKPMSSQDTDSLKDEGFGFVRVRFNRRDDFVDINL